MLKVYREMDTRQKGIRKLTETYGSGELKSNIHPQVTNNL